MNIHSLKFGEWMGPSDCEVLKSYASKVKKGLIVEIGVWMGKSATVMALASPSSKVIGIDSYEKPYEHICSIALENTKDTKNIKIVHNTSNNIYKKWNKKIDLLHIDGGHDYKQVKKDLRWIKFVKKGGVILVHDYTANELPEVAKAVDEKFEPIIESGFAVIIK